jgi:FixJ family two-component response regulator
VVDDDENMRVWVCEALAEEGYECRTFVSGDAFLAVLDQLAPGCLLLDMRMPRRSGIQVQAELVRLNSPMKVIVITGASNVETIVEAMKLGAIDVLEKPFKVDALFEAVRVALAAVTAEK